MKVALVKQVLDVHGPWASVRWDDTTPRRLFDVWPGKALFWEMTCLFAADWYVVPQRLETGYAQDAVLKHPGRREMIMKHVTNVVTPEAIPLEEYDIVITFDPILDVPARSRTLFTYYCQEHWDEPYRASLREPIGNYDLFLAHMMDTHQELVSLPQPISFPYLRAPDAMRTAFPSPKEEAAWADWRLLTTLGMTEQWDASAEAARTRLEERIGLPMRCRGNLLQSHYGVWDPPLWGDPARYLEALGRCRYYIAMGQIWGAGQAIGDAASLGCLCLGDARKVYHCLLCHPNCLCSDMIELPRSLRRVLSSPDLQGEVLAWQDANTRKHFVDGPIAILEKALEMKRSTN